MGLNATSVYTGMFGCDNNLLALGRIAILVRANPQCSPVHVFDTDFHAHVSFSVAHGRRVERRAPLPVLDFAAITWDGIAESRGDLDS